MKVQNKNNSSIKTKALIKKTFVELMDEKKSLNHITVTELVKRANINRGTFYTHYDSIYDIAEEFEAETINLLANDNQELNTYQDMHKYFDKVVFYLKKNETTYQMLLSSNEPYMFLNKLSKLLNEKIKHFLKYNRLNDSDLNISFFVDGLMLQVLKYFKGEKNYSLDELSIKAKEWFKMLFTN